MGHGQGPEGDDAFELAAAQLRPEWASGPDDAGARDAGARDVGTPIENTAVVPAPTAPVARAPVVVEPSVIVQADIALAPPPPPPPPPSAARHSGFAVPSTSTRHEATVVTKPLPAGLIAQLRTPPTVEMFAGDEFALAQAQRSRKLQLLGVAAAGCVALGVIIALLTGGKSEPVAPPAPPVATAPVVQPLPTVAPAVLPKPSKQTVSRSVDSKPARAVAATSAPQPAPKKKAAPPAKAKQPPAKIAKPVIARQIAPKAAAKAPAKPAPKAAGKAGKVGAKAPVDNTKKARSPIDVLNPWGS